MFVFRDETRDYRLFEAFMEPKPYQIYQYRCKYRSLPKRKYIHIQGMYEISSTCHSFLRLLHFVNALQTLVFGIEWMLTMKSCRFLAS